jgi:hypothetical protein
MDSIDKPYRCAGRWLGATAALALWAGSAAAADWRQIAANEQVALYIDATSVASVGTLRQATFLWDWREDRPTPPRTQPPQNYRSSTVQIAFDCFSQRIADTQAVYYASAGASGDVIDTYALTDPTQVPFRDPDRGSLDEGVLRLVCDAKQPE